MVLLVSDGARADVLHRFAVIAGNDSGGADTRPLLYASADASKVYDILTRLGGVRTEDANLIVDGGASDVLSALAKVEKQAAEAARHGEHTALFFYYSGHAKDGALRLGESRLPIDALKGLVAAAPVDVRIVILDSCRSGSITRSKGARKAPAFAIESESPRDAKGLVILTSSASDEDSQESDAIGGSYFSHHLASGLLGGADRSGDGQVTLFEAYAYAYDRTVADTAESAAGAQHPTFSYDLAGNGDLVLTDVASRHEGVYFPRQAPSGVYFLVDRQGFVAAEINKGDGVDRRVALSPGRYRVKRRLADRLRVGEIDVSARPAGHPGRGDAARRAVLRRSGQGRPRRPRRALVGRRGPRDSRRCSRRPAARGSSPPPPSSRSTSRCATSCAVTGCWGSTSRAAAPTAWPRSWRRRFTSARRRSPRR